MNFDPKKLKHYPKDPGVYLMKDKANHVLYIGKAKNLQSRLKQYFLSHHDDREMIPYLIEAVTDIQTIVVTTEKEALILENNLIKKHKPKYNVLLKDDKTYVHLLLTNHKWPLLKIVRERNTNKKKGIYFGPYTSAKAARQTFDLISRVFPLRQCSDTELANRTRPCLLYDIKRCIAPCTNRCTKKDYDEHVNRVKKLLCGQDKLILKELKTKMENASEKLEFEIAANYLDMIRQIEHIQEVQHVDNAAGTNSDVVGIIREQELCIVALLMFREGKLIGSEHFSFTQVISDNESILSTFLIQHYSNPITKPKYIYLPLSLKDRKHIEEIVEIKIETPTRGNKFKLIEIAHRNAKSLIEREKDTRSLVEKRLLDLQDTLGLTRFPRRIECFDTSNLSGDEPVACMITFVNGKRDKKHTKLFKIRDQEKPDDYAAMRQALLRYYTKQKQTNDFCDLLVVDGGKGQLNIALKVLDELNIASIDIIALTKDAARHDKGLTQEKIYIPYQKEPIFIEPRSPLLFLLQQIRDEAHRTAITFQRKRQGKKIFENPLDTVPGIGPIKKKKLLMHFGSIKRLKQASKEDLDEIPGLTQKDKQNIINILLIN